MIGSSFVSVGVIDSGIQSGHSDISCNIDIRVVSNKLWKPAHFKQEKRWEKLRETLSCHQSLFGIRKKMFFDKKEQHEKAYISIGGHAVWI